MTASHELLYFDISGRGDPIRILLHIAGIDFKDVRLTFAEWPAIKPTTNLGSLPNLTIGDKTYCQSIPLTTYAAKLAGWYPEDPLAALVCDEVVFSLSEMVLKVPPKIDDKEEMKKLRQEFQETTMTQFIKFVEKRVQENGGLYVSGTSPTYADLYVRMTVSTWRSGFFDYMSTDFFDAFPGLIATDKAIEENEQVVAYFNSIKKE